MPNSSHEPASHSKSAHSSPDQPHMTPETAAVLAGRPPASPDGPVNPPIVASSTLHAGGPHGYMRDWNDTYGALEALLGELEGGLATVFSSGMAAANAAFDLFEPGAVVVSCRYSYTGVSVRLRELADSGRINLRLIDATENDELKRGIIGEAGQAPASWVWLESPTNPMLEICDITYAAEVAHSVNAVVIVDNTFMTPARQNPLALGADIVMHSVTKGLAGHSDLLMGALVTNDQDMCEKIVMRRVLLGAVPSAFDAFLAIRGIRTLFVRMDRAEFNAQELAELLQSHPAVAKVHYPGLPSHKNAGVAKDQTRGPGSVMSFEVKGSADDAQRVCESVQLLTHATSLGGVETLLERRRRWAAENTEIPDNLIRLSVGIENVDDIWADLKAALDLIL